MIFSFLTGSLAISQPDKGRDRGGQSLCSCFGDTCEPARCLDGGRSAQTRGRRSFRCTSCLGSLRSVGHKMEERNINEADMHLEKVFQGQRQWKLKKSPHIYNA